MQLIARAVTALALLLCCGSDGAMAQQKTPAQAAAAALPSLPVTLEQALYLIRSTLLTLNDANRTGNYTVLRDLAAPDFQARNTAADLALNFLDLRRPQLRSLRCGIAGAAIQRRARARSARNAALGRLHPDPAAADPVRSHVSDRGRAMASDRHRDRNPGSRIPPAASPGDAHEAGRACAEEDAVSASEHYLIDKSSFVARLAAAPHPVLAAPGSPD
ncbi:hypothetical protein [Bradyrhizobium ottawaense]|uniref:hypothetical protein n=1 Tax=Bradyrhizobium ottawaense TaxID=931866 RepID=UPI003517F9B8